MDHNEIQELTDLIANPETRLQALKQIQGYHSEAALKLIASTMDDHNPRIREEAIRCMMQYELSELLPYIEPGLRNDDNANLRNTAIDTFVLLGKKSTQHLSMLLKDKNEEIRCFSAVMLGRIADPESVESLLEALDDEEVNVQHAAVESLGKIGDARAVKKLLKNLSGDFWVRYPTIVALGELKDPRATKHLLALLDDEMIRDPVIEALGKIADPNAIPTLVQLLDEDNATLRNNVIAALINIKETIEKTENQEIDPSSNNLSLDSNDRGLKEHLLQSLEEPDPQIVKNAIIALGWLKEPSATNKLIALLDNFEFEEYVIAALVKIGEPALDKLIDELPQAHPTLRASLIRCIGWIGEQRGYKACIKHLSDPELHVRQHALLALRHAINLPEIENALLHLLPKADPELRFLLGEVLHDSNSKKLPEKLLDRLDKADNTEKLAIIQILGRLQYPQASHKLSDLLNNANSDIQAESLKALQAIGAEHLNLQQLFHAAKSLDKNVRMSVAKILPGFKQVDMLPLIKELIFDHDPNVALEAIKAVKDLNSSDWLPVLIDVFNESRKYNKLAILDVIGKYKDKAASSFLTKILKGSDPDLKQASLSALGNLSDTKTIPEIVSFLDDPDWSVRNAAVIALGKIKDIRSHNYLIKALNDQEDIVKKHAINSLCDIGSAGSMKYILPLFNNEKLQLEVLNAMERLNIKDWEAFDDFFTRCNTRQKAIIAKQLGRTQPTPELISRLIDMLNDQFYTVRMNAAYALGIVGDQSVIPALRRTQKEDPSNEVQTEAAKALQRMQKASN